MSKKNVSTPGLLAVTSDTTNHTMKMPLG